MEKVRSAGLYKVVVVIPVYKNLGELSDNELRALLQVKRILGSRDISLIYPPSVQIDEYCKMFLPLVVNTLMVNKKFFGCCRSSNQLLLMESLYRSFSNYEYMLIHHLDSFVFSDQLDYWCSQKIDYIGAPWLKETISRCDPQFLGVGNGGFSLRNVHSFLTVLKKRVFVHFHTKVFLNDIIDGGYDLKIRKKKSLIRILQAIEKLIPNEDRFWGLVVPRYFKWFVVARPEQALQFSFEALPKILFVLNDKTLPFGCHAWEKFEPAFWRPFIAVDECKPIIPTPAPLQGIFQDAISELKALDY